MKKIIQFFLLLTIIFLFFFFYNFYFLKDTETLDIKGQPADKIKQKSTNNLIKNLKYEININKENQYIIYSELSELVNINQKINLVKMKTVTAKIIDKNNQQIIIKSDRADYNNNNHNTIFEKNASIRYNDKIILSDKIYLDFKTKLIEIVDNVKIQGESGSISTDNIRINLITKKINLFMNNNDDEVIIEKY